MTEEPIVPILTQKIGILGAKQFVRNTVLTVMKEYSGKSEKSVEEVIEEVIPEINKRLMIDFKKLAQEEMDKILSDMGKFLEENKNNET